MSEMPYVSIENSAVEGSPIDLTVMLGKPGKVVTLPSFSGRLKNIQLNFLPFTMEAGAGEEIETEEEADNIE